MEKRNPQRWTFGIRVVLRRILLVLSVGYILMFFSEHLFWARFRPGSDSWGSYLCTWITYSLAGYATLTLISIFRVRRAAAVFLAGAAFGWLIEGVAVGTTYESLPLSISFTALAWHAWLSVGIGLWVIPKLLSRNSLLLLPVSIVSGLFSGAWAVNWNANSAEYHASAVEFVFFAMATSALLAIAYGIFTAVRREPLRIHPLEGALLAGLVAFFFLFRAIAQPVAACILPPLMGVTILALWLNRRRETAESLLAYPLAPVPVLALATLFLMPATAAGLYAPATWLDLKLQTNILFYLVLTPLGFGLYFFSLWRI